MSIQMIASADNHTIRKANEAMHDIGVVPMRPAGLAGIGLLLLAESEPRLLPMPTGRRTGDADRWAAAWVTKATGAELRRLAHFSFRRSEEKVDPRTVSHAGALAHFMNKLKRCVGRTHTWSARGASHPCDALAQQLVENARVLASGLTSTDEQRRKHIVNAIEAEMEKTSARSPL